MRFPHGPGFGMFGGILESIIAGLFFLVCLVVIVGLLFILVRFLLVATKAAEVYVAKNSAVVKNSPVVKDSPAQPVAPAAAPRTRPTKTPPTA
jgi:hypothetical protein